MFWLLIILTFFLPFQVALSPLSGVDLASLRLIIVILALIGLFLALLKKQIKLSGGGVAFGLVAFMLISAFSFFFAKEVSWAIRKWIYFASIFPIFFLMLSFSNYSKQIKIIAKSLVLGAGLVSFVGIMQFLLQWLWGWQAVYDFWSRYMANLFLGGSLAKMVLGYPSWLVNIEGRTVLRATATFPDPHMFSLFLGLAFPIALGIFFCISKRFLWLGLSLIILLANLMTFSRGGYLGLLIGLVFLGGATYCHLSKKYQLRSVLIVAFILILVFCISPLRLRVLSSFDLQEGSNIGRLAMWKEAISTIQRAPYWGVGLGNFPLSVEPSADYRKPIYAHNTYLDIASETGLINLIVWIVIFITAFKRFWKLAKKDSFFLFPLVSLVTFCVHSIFETGIYSPVVLATLLIILSWSYAKE